MGVHSACTWSATGPALPLGSVSYALAVRVWKSVQSPHVYLGGV